MTVEACQRSPPKGAGTAACSRTEQISLALKPPRMNSVQMPWRNWGETAAGRPLPRSAISATLYPQIAAKRESYSGRPPADGPFRFGAKVFLPADRPNPGPPRGHLVAVTGDGVDLLDDDRPERSRLDPDGIRSEPSQSCPGLIAGETLWT